MTIFRRTADHDVKFRRARARARRVARDSDARGASSRPPPEGGVGVLGTDAGGPDDAVRGGVRVERAGGRRADDRAERGRRRVSPLGSAPPRRVRRSRAGRRRRERPRVARRERSAVGSRAGVPARGRHLPLASRRLGLRVDTLRRHRQPLRPHRPGMRPAPQRHRHAPLRHRHRRRRKPHPLPRRGPSLRSTRVRPHRRPRTRRDPHPPPRRATPRRIPQRHSWRRRRRRSRRSRRR